MKTIASRQHAIVRAFRELAGEPDPAGARLLLDGVHQVREGREAGVAFEAIAVAGSLLDAATEEGELARTFERDGAEVYAMSDQVLAAVSPVRSPSGIVAIGRRTPVNASMICRRDHVFALVAVDVQDPGNLGALIRAAEAGGATGAIVCGASANPFSWKALRGSMGSTLRLPVAHGLEALDVVACARRFGARTVAAVARGGQMPDDIAWSGNVALFLGAEGTGLDPELVSQCDERVTIPMAPPVESLNVAVAAAILVYAARRQRL